jgi:hypothetical protein
MAPYTPGLKPYEAKFFKIWEQGYDSAQGADYILTDVANGRREMGQCHSL